MVKKNHLIKLMLGITSVSIKFCCKEFGSKDFYTQTWQPRGMTIFLTKNLQS